MEPQELPQGFAMALARNPDAMARFTAMSEAEQQSVLQQVHTVQSKREMQDLVSQLTNKQ